MKRLSALIMFFSLSAFVAQACSAGWRTEKIRGSGDVTTEERQVSGVDGVELATIGVLFIEIGDEEKLVIEAEDNLLEHFETDVRGGVLTIETRERVNLRPREPVRYYLTVKKLDEIEISSSGDIEAPDLVADRFNVTIGGSGNFDMGNLDASSVDIRVRSSGDVSMDAVITKKAEIDIQSSGDVRLRELEAQLLVVDISSSGNVDIRGGTVQDQEIMINSSGDYKGEALESQEASVHVNSSGDATVRVEQFLDARTYSSGDIYYIGDPKVRTKRGSSGKIKKIR